MLSFQNLPVYASETEMAKLAGFSPSYLKIKRRGDKEKGIEPELIEGVHWFRASERGIRYQVFLVLDFFRNRYNPELHQKVVQAHLASLPANQSRPAGRHRKLTAAK